MPIIHYHNVEKNGTNDSFDKFYYVVFTKRWEIVWDFFSRDNSNNFAILYYIFEKKTLDVNNWNMN